MTLLTKKLQLIGIVGNAGTGKDSVASYLAKSYDQVYSEHWAGALKLACSVAFGIGIEEFQNQEAKETRNQFWGTTPRKIAQFVGTELFRNEMWKLVEQDQNDFWVRRMAGILDGILARDSSGEVIDFAPEDVILIPDTRFQNEVDFLIENDGLIIYLKRPGYDGGVGIANHPSEQLNQLEFGGIAWLIENNGTEEELFLKVDKFVDATTAIKFLSKPTDSTFPL